jgi:diguanylate cyclase (GGDEF)-like protein
MVCMTPWTLTLGSACRLLLALGGLAAGAVLGSWQASATCFAGLAALSLAHAMAAERREHEYRLLSRSDPLTGVGNYRRLHDGLHAATAADPQRFALLTLDVDSFKAINEVHGHLEGDRLLQAVGRVLEENVRTTDVVARQGGDEFSVLLPEADEAGAAMLAERIEQALAKIQAADQAPVRASIGMAVFPEDGATPDDLLESADLDLRRIKERRRAALADAARTARVSTPA